MTSVVLIFSSILTDAVAGSPFQEELILGLRYFAFALVVAEIAIQACAKEPSYDREQPLQIRKVFTLPFRYRKFCTACCSCSPGTILPTCPTACGTIIC